MSNQPANSELKDRHEEFVSALTAAYDKLFGYLLSLLGRWHDAQDVLQRSSLVMWQKFETFEVGTDFVAWASTICFYEAKNFLRQSSRSPLKFDDELLAILAWERLDDLEFQRHRISALEECLKKVRPAERELLQAAYVEPGKIVELATRLGRAPRTLYNKLNLLRQRLVECVQRRLQERIL